MRQKLITLDPITWDLALKKPNFSAWVRDKLREERNKRSISPQKCIKTDCFERRIDDLYCAYHAELGPVATWISVGEEE
jgi:hypothetical protein